MVMGMVTPLTVVAPTDAEPDAATVVVVADEAPEEAAAVGG